MNVNVTELKIIESNAGKFFRFAMINEEMKPDEYTKKIYPTYYVISRPEIPLVLDCLRGKTEFFPWFDDGNYHIRFTPGGIQSVDLSREKYQRFYFHLPGEQLADEIEPFFNVDFSNDCEDAVIDKTPILPFWKKHFAPKVKVIFGDNVEEKLSADQKHILLEELPGDLVPDLIKWASNYSDGNLITVNIVFDYWKNDPDCPSNYYWYLYDEEKKVRIVNGGWIAHKVDNNKYRYSMHT
jgi:hypothetical protein